MKESWIIRKKKDKSEWYFELYVPIYKLFVRIYKDKSEYEKLIRNCTEEKDYEVSKGSDGCTWHEWIWDKNYYCYVCWLEDYDVNSIFVHELFHLVCTIQEQYNIGEEACAYLIEYIYREFNNKR